jgi:hypothetical protein
MLCTINHSPIIAAIYIVAIKRMIEKPTLTKNNQLAVLFSKMLNAPYYRNIKSEF